MDRNTLSLVNGVTSETDETKLIDIPGKIYWNEMHKEKFKKSLCSEKIKNKIESLSEKSLKDNSSSSCIQAVKMITDLFNSIVDDCNIRTKPKVSKSTKGESKKWFDRECKTMRDNLRKLGKIVSHERKNSHTRTDLYRMKKQFKGLLKRKKLHVSI